MIFLTIIRTGIDLTDSKSDLINCTRAAYVVDLGGKDISGCQFDNFVFKSGLNFENLKCQVIGMYEVGPFYLFLK